MSNNVCVWKYMLNIRVWKGDCGMLFNAKLLKQVQGGMPGFKFCPQCGKTMLKERTADVEELIRLQGGENG